MQDLAAYGLSVFMGFFAIMNPIANTPIFLGLTSDLSPTAQRRAAAQSTLLAFAIVTVFTIGGHFLFDLFGIGLPAFRIAGGILVFLIGKHLLEGQATSPIHTPKNIKEKFGDSNQSPNHEEAPESNVAISPLAIPILAGPGTIACAINFSSGHAPLEIGICIALFAVMCACTYLMFIGGERLVAALGQQSLGVVSRLMGMILAVIGVQMFLTGLGNAFPLHFR